MPLPYEALTKLIDEASEGDMSISTLTQVGSVIKPSMATEESMFVIDLNLDMHFPSLTQSN